MTRIDRPATVLISLLAIMATLLPACASRTVRPDIRSRAPRIHAIGIVPPRVSIYQLSAGGQRELIEDWSAQGRNNILGAAVRKLSGRKTALGIVELDTDTADELDEVFPLYEAIGDSIAGRSRSGVPHFDRRPKRFEYSVGSLDRIAARHGVDAFLVMSGYDEISTSGRKALIAVGKITGILFGDPPPKGATAMTMALLDRDGAVLWFGNLEDEGGYDLRSGRSSTKAVEAVLKTFPGAIR